MSLLFLFAIHGWSRTHMEVWRLRITNIPALTSYNSMMSHNAIASKAVQRLSTGLRINSAADDAAGLAMSQRMEAQIRGTYMEIRNAQDHQAALHTADGSLDEVQEVMGRMRTLIVQAANDSLNDDDRSYIQTELEQLTLYIEDVLGSARFNGVNVVKTDIRSYFKSFVISELHDNEADAEKTLEDVTRLLDQDLSMNEIYDSIFHTFRQTKWDEDDGRTLRIDGRAIYVLSGPDGDARMVFNLDTINNSVLGTGGLDVSSSETAAKSITRMDKAIEKVSEQRAQIGAEINTTQSRIDYLTVQAMNLEDARSRITDADIAKEMMTFTKHNIMSQVSSMVMAQANNLLQTNILNLFKMNL